WATRHGGSFEPVNRLVLASIARRLAIGVFMLGVVVAVLYAIAAERQASTAAARNFRLAVNSVQSLLGQISKSLSYGSVSQKGARDFLDISEKILRDVQDVEQTLETTGMTIEVQQNRHDILFDLGDFKGAYA